MSDDLLRHVLAVPGVSDAVLEYRDGTPVVRVWLGGSRSAGDVAGDIRNLVGSGPGRAEVVAGAQRRSGLGRGLEALIPGAVQEPAPTHLKGLEQVTDPATDLAAVAVIERSEGVTIRAEDASGRSAEATTADDDDLGAAVVRAVCSLVGDLPPRSVTVEERDVAGRPIVTVLVESAAGSVLVGSSLVSGGRAFAIARAAWTAIQSTSQTA